MKTIFRSIIIILIAIGCTNNKQNKPIVFQNPCYILSDSANAISEAKRIISRAIEIIQYVPTQKERDNLTIALKSLKIYTADINGKVKMNVNEDQFKLVIIDPKYLHIPTSDHAKTLMQFDDKAADQYHCFVVNMNVHIASLTDNLDGKACMLIHELIHALQANSIIIHGGKANDALHYPREQQAWESETYLYTQLHPDILKIKCNCEDFSVKFPDDVKYLRNDWVSVEYALYQLCRDKYLQTLYDKNK